MQQHWSHKDAETYNDDGAGDGDGRHASVGDGVPPVGVADTLVIAVDASLVRTEHQCQDSWGQTRWRNKRPQSVLCFINKASTTLNILQSPNQSFLMIASESTYLDWNLTVLYLFLTMSAHF